MFKLIMNSIVFLVIIACITGCYSTDKRHNAAHNRAIKKDMKLLHQDIDFVLGLDEPSVLSDEKSLEVITDS
ncbi:MAG: hypothetical protein MRK02_11245 [Candidatus Scalindua sp.]|nr:hypothetical protein [Candidatus Scalindua sp.]